MTSEEFDQRCEDLKFASADVKQQAVVMFQALDIFVEREQVRGGLWKKMGTHDSAYQLKSKTMRLMAMLSSGLEKKPELTDEAVDDALDAVNYAVFFIRNLRAGRFGQI